MTGSSFVSTCFSRTYGVASTSRTHEFLRFTCCFKLSRAVDSYLCVNVFEQVGHVTITIDYSQIFLLEFSSDPPAWDLTPDFAKS